MLLHVIAYDKRTALWKPRNMSHLHAPRRGFTPLRVSLRICMRFTRFFRMLDTRSRPS